MKQVSDQIKSKVFEVLQISSFKDLRDLSKRRSGYSNSDGGFGVIYPHELDDHDRDVDGISIPSGMIQIYGFWGTDSGGFEFQL